MIKKISFAGLAVALVVATTPHAWAEGDVPIAEPNEALPAAQAEAARVTVTPGWQVIGTCEWNIDSAGCLIIRPSDNGPEGTLPSGINSSSWLWNNFASSIKSIKIEGIVSCGEKTRHMFTDLTSLSSVNLDGLDTANVRSMDYMFEGCSSLATIDVSHFDTSNVVSMAGMFEDCSSLTSIDFGNFDTASVQSMMDMFSGCESLESLNLDLFDTSNVTSMYGMFDGCRSITSLDLRNFNTSNVTNMSRMFAGCASLENIDLSSFNTSNVTNMGSMFLGCGVKTLDLSSFDTRKATYNSGSFFSGYEPPLECLTIGDNFTLQRQIPNKTWYNAAGQTFTPNTIPTGVAGTYATSMDWFEDLAVSLSESEKTVSVSDDPFTLIATVTPAMKAEDPAWSSSDPDVASVDSTGTVTVHKAGKATITATVKDAHASCGVTVNPLFIVSSADSSTTGQVTIDDAETAKTLKGYSLLIRPSVHKGSAEFEQHLLADIAQQQGKAGTIADLLDVCFIDTTTGAEMDPTVAESLPPLALGLDLDNSVQALIEKNNLSLWEASSAGDAAKTDAALTDNSFQLHAIVPGTYAIIATPKSDSSGSGGTTTDPDDGDKPGTNPDNGDKPGTNPDDGNKPGTNPGDSDDTNPGDGDKPSTPGIGDNPPSSSDGGTLPPASTGNSSNNNTGAGSDSTTSKSPNSVDGSSSQAKKNSSNDKVIPQTGDTAPQGASSSLALALGAAAIAGFSLKQLRNLEQSKGKHRARL